MHSPNPEAQPAPAHHFSLPSTPPDGAVRMPATAPDDGCNAAAAPGEGGEAGEIAVLGYN